MSARPHTPANPAAAMARPTATIVLACMGRTHTGFVYRRTRAESPPAARTAGRARRHQPATAQRAGHAQPGRGQRGRDPRAVRDQGNTARRRPVQNRTRGLCGTLAPRPRPSRARGPRERPGRARPAPLTHHVRPSAARHGPPQPPQSAAAAVKRGEGAGPGTAPGEGGA